MPGTVTIASKLPTGMVLRVFEMVQTREAVPGGFHEVPMARQKGGSVEIKGVATPFGVEKPLVGGYALTHNVDADLWSAWLDQNKDHDAVVNGMIFAHERQDHAKGKAKDGENVASGQEPLRQKGDPRAPRAKGVSAVETAA